MIGLVYRNSVSSIDLEFTTTSNSTGLTIMGFTSTANIPNTIVIPDQINDDLVTQIDSSAFANCTSLTEVHIPNSATSNNSYPEKA